MEINCKGCAGRQIEEENVVGCNGIYNKEGECPCTNCLVKVTCDHLCDEYQDFIVKIMEKIDNRRTE